MKIGIVCYPTFGGSGVVATELGLELSKRGHEIHFITYKQPVRLELLGNNVHFHEVNVPEYPLFHYQPYELALSSKLVDMVKLHGIEILHVHYAIPHAYAAYMAQKMLKEENIYVPIVTTLHGTDITLVGSHPFYKPAVTFSINKSDAVTSVSQSLKDDTLRLFNINNEINVITNFIDLSKYHNEFTDCQRDLMASEKEVIITHISNFRPVKGGIPEVNTHGVSGFLSAVGDIDDMVTNALAILKDKKTLNAFKKSARHEAAKYDIHAIVPKYETIYQQTLTRCISV